MRGALQAWLLAAARGADHVAACRAAAEVDALEPWEVVRNAGLLARCEPTPAPHDLGLDAHLRVREVNDPACIARVAAGAPFPQLANAGRRARGAFDTPVAMARQLVAAARLAVEGRCEVALDPACGPGAFLVALLEAGLREVRGADIDPAALAVASVAAPSARLSLADAFSGGEVVDLVVGNPPFVPPERQDRLLRARVKVRFPWMRGRFDLVVPFAELATERVRRGGAVGLIVPSAMLSQPYAAPLRRRWVQRHELIELAGPYPFPGASVDVGLVVMRCHTGPAPLPLFGIAPDELLRLENAPLNPDLMPGDIALVEKIRDASFPLGSFCRIDTGVVAHGPKGGKERLITDTKRPGSVPYADAREFFEGDHRWLQYDPAEMHRPKSPEMFENPKIVIQRLRGRKPVRAAIDWDGIYVGHTCTVVYPRQHRVPLDRVLDLVRSPLIDGLSRIESGHRLDLYPRDVASFPVPKAWIDRPHLGLAEAWGLLPAEIERLESWAAR